MRIVTNRIEEIQWYCLEENSGLVLQPRQMPGSQGEKGSASPRPTIYTMWALPIPIPLEKAAFPILGHLYASTKYIV